MKRRIYVVTDGSAIGNPGPGGWAAVFACGRERWTLSGSVSWTTSAEMELTAAIEALRSMRTDTPIDLGSDSEYLIRGMRYLAVRWRGHGWRNSRGEPLQHQELWRELLQFNAMFPIRWRWVKGHDGHPLQTRADQLAYSEARSQYCELRRAA